MRKILVLGATSAIAQETCRFFAADEDALFLVGRNEVRLTALSNDLIVHGASLVDCYVADLNDFAQHPFIIKRASEVMSGIDMVLIAYGTLPDQKACERDFAGAEREFRTNFLGIASLLTILANRFEAEKKGMMAVISSVAGDRGRQSNYVYGTAKGALSLFLQGLRNRLCKSGVGVLTIKPGFVDTPMTASFKKGFLFAKPDVVAQGIYRAILQRRNVVYLPWFWRWIMLAVRIVPEAVFKRLKF